jgi:hypothetical protein
MRGSRVGRLRAPRERLADFGIGMLGANRIFPG